MWMRPSWDSQYTRTKTEEATTPYYSYYYHYYSYYYAGLNDGFKNGSESAPFDVPFHLLINLAVGGNLPGAVNNADIPSEMVVDYVRVYRCTYDNDGGRGCNSNVNR